MQLLIALTKRMEWFRDALQQSLEPNGIDPFTPAQLLVISKIASGEHRAINIARGLGVSRQAVSQILAELERRGVVSVAKDSADGRSRVVKFRDQFEENGNACAWILDGLEDELGRRIGARRLAGLRDALDAGWGEPPVVGDLRLQKSA